MRPEEQHEEKDEFSKIADDLKPGNSNNWGFSFSDDQLLLLKVWMKELGKK